MTEIEILTNQLTEAVIKSKEYNQYKSILEKIKSQPDLYNRIGEYHRRSLALQLSDCENIIYENNKLQKEFIDLQNNGLSNEFFAAEHQYCSLVKKIQNTILEAVDIDTGFLEE